MTITIEAAPELMEAIEREATREGLTPQEFALQAVAEKVVSNSPPASKNALPVSEVGSDTRKAQLRAEAQARRQRLSQLLDRWRQEDVTDDPEELARRQREGDEFMASLHANRFNIPQDPALVALLESMDG